MHAMLYARPAVATLVGFVIMTREPSIHVFPADAGRGAEEVWRCGYIGKGEMGEGEGHCNIIREQSSLPPFAGFESMCLRLLASTLPALKSK